MTMDYGQQSRADLKLSSPHIGSIMDSPTSFVAAANTSAIPTTDKLSSNTKTANNNCSSRNSSNGAISATSTTTTKTPPKRSFDVAFLIRPDENLKHKQARQSLALATAAAAEQAYEHQQQHFQRLTPLHHQPRQPLQCHSPDEEENTTSSSSHASPPLPSAKLMPHTSMIDDVDAMALKPLNHHHISVKSDEVLRGASSTPIESELQQRYSGLTGHELISNQQELFISRSYEQYNRMALRMPQLFDHSGVLVPAASMSGADSDVTKDEHPRSAFTKVHTQQQHHHSMQHHLQHQSSAHQLHQLPAMQPHAAPAHQHLIAVDSPPPQHHSGGPSVSPDRLSCPSTSPPISLSPPTSTRASGTQPPSPMPPSPVHIADAASPSSSSSSSHQQQQPHQHHHHHQQQQPHSHQQQHHHHHPQQHIMYQNFRPEYRQFVSAAAAAGQFQTISHQLQQAAAASHQMGQQKLKQQQQQQHQHSQLQQQQNQHPAHFMYRASSSATSPVAAAAAAAAAAIAANAEHINKFMGSPQQLAAVQHHLAAQHHQQQQHQHQQQLHQHQQQQHQQQHNHSNLHHQQHPNHQQQHVEMNAVAVRHPAAAAALLTSLIPPTLATSFTLTAQNVCAKCNISFRMTSDLVYHMRSHHKSEFTGDTNRRKREEKLKCPVCNESFRERHHLTRHMTAHQDKASDEAPPLAATPTSGSSSGRSELDHCVQNHQRFKSNLQQHHQQHHSQQLHQQHQMLHHHHK